MTLASSPAALTTFKDLVLKHSKSPFRSFTEGLPWEWEHYKQVVRDEALRILNADAWQNIEVGSGKISSSPFSRPSKMPAAAVSGAAFGISKPRFISVSTGPMTTA